jgi:hypothetical protein
MSQRQDSIELRVARPKIVDGDPRASIPIAVNYFGQALAVATQLGDLEHDTAGVYAVFLQLLEAWQGLTRAQASDPAWRNVQAQKPIVRGFMQTAQCVITNTSVQTAQCSGGHFRVGKQRAYRLQSSVVLTQASQCFNTRNTAGSGIDEWLKAGNWLPIDHMASSEKIISKNIHIH